MNSNASAVLVSFSASLLLGAFSATVPGASMATNHSVAPATQSMTEMAEAEVRKVDREAKKITLRHGELRQLDMPPMTMVFQVRDAALLDTIKAGDKVKFKAENVGGAFFVTEIAAAK